VAVFVTVWVVVIVSVGDEVKVGLRVGVWVIVKVEVTE